MLSLMIFLYIEVSTAKILYRKFETYNTRIGTARRQSQFLHSCFCERFLYIPLIGIAYSAAGEKVGRMWKYIDRSQTHECGKGD